MRFDLPARDKRALKALAIALGAGAIWLGHNATWAGDPRGKSIEALEQRYLLARERANSQPGRERNARALDRSLRILEDRLLAADSPSLAQAEIRSISTNLLSDAGIGAPVSVFGSLGADGDPYIGIPLDLEFVCQADQLARFMAALAGTRPILATRDVRISAESAETGTIRVRLTVEGYLSAGRSDAPSRETGERAGDG